MFKLDIPFNKIKSEYSDEHSRFLQLDDLTIHYKDEGEGPPLLLLHGALTSLRIWEEF